MGVMMFGTVVGEKVSDKKKALFTNRINILSSFQSK